MKTIDLSICKKLFCSDYSKISDERLKKLDNLTHSILKEISWDDAYACFNNYLRNECETEDAVINYVRFFVHYFGLKFQIPKKYDPYDLVGYIYSMVDLEKRWEDCGGEFDDFANEALKIDLYHDPYYQFWRDPKIIEIADRYKKERINLNDAKRNTK